MGASSLSVVLRETPRERHVTLSHFFPVIRRRGCRLLFTHAWQVLRGSDRTSVHRRAFCECVCARLSLSPPPSRYLSVVFTCGARCVVYVTADGAVSRKKSRKKAAGISGRKRVVFGTHRGSPRIVRFRDLAIVHEQRRAAPTARRSSLGRPARRASSAVFDGRRHVTRVSLLTCCVATACERHECYCFCDLRREGGVSRPGATLRRPCDVPFRVPWGTKIRVSASSEWQGTARCVSFSNSGCRDRLESFVSGIRERDS